MDGVLGLKGWQWVFIVEAIPPVLLAFIVLKTMDDTPATATWLRSEEKAWLSAQLAQERIAIESRGGKPSLFQALGDARVLRYQPWS
jgi:ACS family tartrate transporter-like MFS transporter